MIEAEHISKYFGKLQALHDVSLKVEDGQCVALVGENGAGKSTLFNILSTLDNDFGGQAKLNGMDVRTTGREIRARIGYVPGRFSLYEDLSVEENLDFFARAYGSRKEDIEELSPHLWQGLKPFSGRRAGHLSGGMKQKLAFCCALVHNPSILLLDEPTVGVDPVARRDMWDEISAQRSRGASILVSTHYLDEASWADRVVLMNKGRVLLDMDSAAAGNLEERFVRALSEKGGEG